MAKESAFPTFTLSDGGVPLCWGCASAGACKLGVRSITVDTETRVAAAVAYCPLSWQGGPGVAHGGWITCIFDEVLGSLPGALDVPCVTANLDVSFRKPVPVDTTVLVTATVREQRPRRWVIEGVMRVAGDEETVYATGAAKFVEPALDHFDKLGARDV